MKSNIIRLESETTRNFYWYTWDEECDKCETKIRTSGSWRTTSEPKEEDDYCLRCLRKLLDLELKSK